MIDDRFTTGVWYDAHTGDFHSIRHHPDTDEVAFCDPDTGKEWERIPAEDFDPADQYPVPDQAVNDPVAFYEDVVQYAISEMGERLPVGDEIGFRYADENTEVAEG